MAHALDQIEHATLEIQALAPQLRHRRRRDLVGDNDDDDDFDAFSHGLRVAVAMTYDEPDQWRIRALRVVMAKLMAAAFPLVLRHPRWAATYEAEWGSLRARVVADHLWLTDEHVGGGQRCQGQEKDEGGGGGRGGGVVVAIERNDLIVAGYEGCDRLWEVYRPEGWQPADDLMFPERGGHDPADLRPVPSTPVLFSSLLPLPGGDHHHYHHGLAVAAGGRDRGRKRSRAIPIMRPDGTSITLPSNEQSPLRTGGQQREQQREPQGKLDCMATPPTRSVSSRAQSWPRGGPRYDPGVAAVPSPTPSGSLAGSPGANKMRRSPSHASVKCSSSSSSGEDEEEGEEDAQSTVDDDNGPV